MARVNREQFLQRLETIQPGLSKRDIVEQSSCFVFRNGRIYTYNDEIACSTKSSVDIEGAVRAEPLLLMLRKFPEEEVEIEHDTKKGEFVVKGKRRESHIQMDEEITLPLDNVDKAGEWRELAEGFDEAVSLVSQCASSDESTFRQTCVHIHKKWVEACDNYQASRYPIKTGVESAFLVKAMAIKKAVSLGVTKISETESWVHFKNSTGLRVSCRRYFEDYDDLSEMLNVSGHAVTLPKGLRDAAETAQVFSAENADRNLLLIEMKPGRLKIKGQGTSGWFVEHKKLTRYEGEPIKFYIPPGLLIELSGKHHDCEISQEFLKVDGGHFTYVTCLGTEEDYAEDEPDVLESDEEE